MSFKAVKTNIKKAWRFIWEDDSIWSWLLNILLAFLLIKFLVYPGLGLVLSTTHPVVAVVSDSMEHTSLATGKHTNFDIWWGFHESMYGQVNISKSQFKTFVLANGFNKGDIIVLKGSKPKDIKTGDIIVFSSGLPDPIIHRIIRKWETNGTYHFQTKGDNNKFSISSVTINEMDVKESQIIGKAYFKIPYLGYIKIAFVRLITIIRGA